MTADKSPKPSTYPPWLVAGAKFSTKPYEDGTHWDIQAIFCGRILFNIATLQYAHGFVWRRRGESNWFFGSFEEMPKLLDIVQEGWDPPAAAPASKASP